MATKANIIVDQGTDFSTDIELTDDHGDPLDLTGYSVRSTFKKWYSSLTETEFDVEIDANAGIITLSLAAATCANIEAGRFVYDVVVTDANERVTRVIEGILTLTPEVA